MMLMDVFQRALTWLLAWEVVGLLAGLLVAVGIPAALAPILVILAILGGIYVVASDRYLLDRWRRRFNRWRRN